MDLTNAGAFNADVISARRFPVVDEELGVTFAFTFYQSMSKAPCSHSKRYADICPAAGPGKGRFTLVMVEVFKIDGGRIMAMESVWALQEPVWRSVWW